MFTSVRKLNLKLEGPFFLTGPAEGKLNLDAQVYLGSNGENLKVEGAVVYIHLKGYALARVTHLDIEHEILNKLLPPKKGKFLTIKGIENGIEVLLGKPVTLNFEGKNLKVQDIKIFSSLLNNVLSPNQQTRTWVGGKFGGIYIGFKKQEVRKLEDLAKTYFNMSPT